jgi:glycogen operon protein
VGHFPGDRWGEWNAQYRDDVRRFLRGDPALVAAVAARLGGSADIYEARGQAPVNSVNFITAHDGFTLNDLVSYDHKHNEANGEGNRDGIVENYSWNCGVEGPTDDDAIERLRVRQIKNACVILLLSRGVPMILSGDEVRRTQRGNNNAYNQDNATSWFDWTLVEKNGALLRFFRRMIAFRKANDALTRPRFYRGETNERGLIDITWHGTRLFSPGFADPDARALACTIAGFGGAPDLHVMMNMYWQPLDFEVPRSAGRAWRVAIDTFQPSPDDLPDEAARVPVGERVFAMQGRSIVVLVGAS